MGKKEDLSEVDIKDYAINQAKELGSSLGELVKKHLTSEENLQDKIETNHQPPPPDKSHTIFLSILKTLPWVLSIAFISARFWDFNGISFRFFENSVSLEGLITTISVGGLIGYLTNWLAITMLFKPKYKRPILGQGLIPAQKGRIAFRFAQAVSTDLINAEIIQKKLEESGLVKEQVVNLKLKMQSVLESEPFRQELRQILNIYLSSLVKEKSFRTKIAKEIIQIIDKSLEENSVEKFALKTYLSFRGEQAITMISNAIENLPQQMESTFLKIDGVFEHLSRLIDVHSLRIEASINQIIYIMLQQFDAHRIVEENILQLDEDKLSDLIKGTTNEQFQYIQYLGALLGMIGGIVIWQPIGGMVVIGSLILVVWLLDILISKKYLHSNK